MKHIKQILKQTIQELQMELSNVTKTWFNLYCEAQEANNNLPDGIEPLDRGQLQAVTTAMFIQANMNGTAVVIQNKSTSQPSDNSDNWDGERLTGFKKGDWAGVKWKDVDDKSVKFFAENNDPKYPNRAQMELDRRTNNDIEEPPPDDEDESQLPF